MQPGNPQHIDASPKDLLGNQGIGRYIFLTGSDYRARQISEHFENIVVLNHPRQHNLYLGTIPTIDQSIDVAAISTGMGGPSADIIINELIMLGAKRLLRLGTAGSMQPERIKVGDVVIATGAVRDDKASWDYIYREYPALSSIEYLIATGRALSGNPDNIKAHFGIVHSKSSLYAREFHLSLMPQNDQYMSTMKQAGILASEMECAQMFVLSSLMTAKKGFLPGTLDAILCGAILAIIGDYSAFSSERELVNKTIDKAISLSLDTIRQLALIDQKKLALF